MKISLESKLKAAKYIDSLAKSISADLVREFGITVPIKPRTLSPVRQWLEAIFHEREKIKLRSKLETMAEELGLKVVPK